MSPAEPEVVIVGGGPAGLSAALVLGRCRRSVVVVDSGKPRNAVTETMHGFLTRDGISPAEFLRLAKADLERYPNVALREGEVRAVTERSGGFDIDISGETILRCKKVLLAMGVVDSLPELPDFAKFYGKTLFHCPYCDGWEFRDRRIAAYGQEERGVKLALTLTAWSPDIVLLTNGEWKAGSRTEKSSRETGSPFGKSGSPVSREAPESFPAFTSAPESLSSETCSFSTRRRTCRPRS
jgi:thioredoxin reductase